MCDHPTITAETPLTARGTEWRTISICRPHSCRRWETCRLRTVVRLPHCRTLAAVQKRYTPKALAHPTESRQPSVCATKRRIVQRAVAADFVDFARRCKARWIVSDVWCDSAEQTLINGLRAAAAGAGLGVNIGNAQKRAINDRIRATCILMGAGRFFVARGCAHTIDALRSALWDSRHVTEDVRLDDGTTNIDSLDAMEYSFEREIPNLIDNWGR